MDYGLYQIIKLLGHYRSAAATAALKKYFDMPEHNYLKEHAMIQLVRNGETANDQLVAQLAADSTISEGFFNDLGEIGKQFVFPEAYRTQGNFAASAMYGASSSDEYDVTGMRFKKTLNAAYKGITYKFYLFRMTYGKGDDKKSYLGIAGGYNVNGDKLLPDEALSGVYWDGQYDADHMKEQLVKYLAGLDREEELAPPTEE